MERHHLGLLAAAVLGSVSMAAVAQQPQQPVDPAYEGVAHPPSDVIVATPDAPVTVTIKPSPSVPAAQPVPQQMYASPAPMDPGLPPPPPMYARNGYNPANDPDGDIVHPMSSGRPGELMSGMTIRVRLKERLSSSMTEKGEPFHGVVISDVLQNDRVIIPAGAGIEGRVTFASSGQHLGGHGSLRLKPEAVILPDGSRVELHAETTGTPGSHTRIGGEGTINPGSRAKRDGIEYGAVVGTGVIAGAVIGGPIGALAGGAVGAGIVTTHVLVDHPQAVLEPGSVILFTLTEPMNLMPAGNPPQGN